MSVTAICLLALLPIVFRPLPNYSWGPGSSWTRSQEKWELCVDAGVPIWIAYNLARSEPLDRKIFVFVEEQDFTKSNLQKIFSRLAEKYHEPTWLKITVFSDRAMLQRAIDVSQMGASIEFADTPKGQAAADKWYEKYYPADKGYFRAIYWRTPDDESFQYSPDQEKAEYLTVIIKAKSAASHSSIFSVEKSAIINAAINGDADTVLSLLAAGMEINATDEYGWTSLLHAVKHSNVAVIKLLLDKGANVNAQSKRGITALHLAAAKGQTDIVRSLLAHGAIAEISSASQDTPLLRAADIGNEEIVKLLLLHGANVDARNSIGETPLLIAYRRKDVLRTLLDNGADINAQDNKGQTALILAISAHSYDAVKILLERGAGVKIRNKRGQTALDIARTIGDKKLVLLLQQTKAPH